MERSRRRPGSRRLVACFAALAACGVGVVAAQNPPQPDFYWPYGVVAVGTANIDPADQPVVAFVNGTACGSARTKTAVAGPGVPASDVGKTVYVVDILADGTAGGQRRGCGHPGDRVILYFPVSGRVAAQRPAFRVGGERVDLDLTVELADHVPLPMTASDGPNE